MKNANSAEKEKGMLKQLEKDIKYIWVFLLDLFGFVPVEFFVSWKQDGETKEVVQKAIIWQGTSVQQINIEIQARARQMYSMHNLYDLALENHAIESVRFCGLDTLK